MDGGVVYVIRKRDRVNPSVYLVVDEEEGASLSIIFQQLGDNSGLNNFSWGCFICTRSNAFPSCGTIKTITTPATSTFVARTSLTFRKASDDDTPEDSYMSESIASNAFPAASYFKYLLDGYD